MRTTTCAQHPLRKGFSGALKQSTMLHLIIDFQAVLAETTRKGIQRPDGQSLWVDRTVHLSGNAACLRIPPELLNQLRVGGAKKSFNHRPKTWLMRRPLQLRHEAGRQQRLHVDAAKFWA